MKINIYNCGVEFTRDWRIVDISIHFKTKDFIWGYSYEWYDGPHKAFGIGVASIYWNW